MSELSLLLKDLDALRKSVRAISSKQVFSKAVCDQLHSIAQRYFANLRPSLLASEEVAVADKLFTQAHELSRKSPSRQKCLDVLTEARRALVRIEGAVLSKFRNSGQTLGTATSEAVALGDLDDDGDLDAFVANRVGGSEIWLNDGDGAFALDSTNALNDAETLDVDLADVDGDGDLDAVLAHPSQPNTLWINGAGADAPGSPYVASGHCVKLW